VDRKGKDKQHWEDDEGQAYTNLLNLIQQYCSVHLIFSLRRVVSAFSGLFDEHYHGAERG
jgi:hypothetical protein